MDREALHSKRVAGDDTPVMGAQSWRVCGLLVLGAGALLATSEPPSYFYRYERSVEGPPVELSVEHPKVRVTLRARPTGLSPDGTPVIVNGAGQVHGYVNEAGSASGEQPFVRVAWLRVNEASDLPTANAAGVTTLTKFELNQVLTFTGACERLTGSPPCEGRLVLELERVVGPAESAVRVTYSVALSATADRQSGDENLGPFDLPWNVEFLEEMP